VVIVTDGFGDQRMRSDVISARKSWITDYKAGKVKLFGFFVGQAMEKTKGKGNPKLIQELLKKHLG